MLRPKSIALVNQKRTLRPLYAQTQAYPYAATLASGTPVTGTDSQTGLLLVDGTSGVSIFPGAVMEKVDVTTENVQLSDGPTNRPFGLSANFVGGNMDELNGRTEIGVWRGRGGVFEVLAPVFLSTLTGSELWLGAGSTSTAIGRLEDVDVVDSDAGSTFGVAQLLTFLSERAIIVELTVGG